MIQHGEDNAMNRNGFVFLVLMVVPLWLGAQNTKFDYFYLEAEKSRLEGDFASALELYEHCRSLRPDAAEVIYQEALLRLCLRQDSLGREMLYEAARLDSCNPWYLETLASVCLNGKDVEAALPVLERMARLQPKRTDVLAQLSYLYKSAGRTQDAIEALQRIERAEGKSTQLSMEKYSLYLDLGEKEHADAELQSLCESFPHDQTCKLLAAGRFIQSGDEEKALAIFEEVKQEDPHNETLQLALLEYFGETNQEEKYKQLRDSLLYEPAVSSNMRLSLMRDYIGKAQRDTTLRAEVEQSLSLVLDMPQEDARMWTMKAAYQIFVGEPEDSVARSMQQVLEIEPNNETALAYLMRYHAQRNDVVGMENVCRRGVNCYPEELGYSYYLGLALHQQERTDEAMEVFLVGLRSKTDEADPRLVSDMYAAVGDLYNLQEQKENAYAAYDSALVYYDNNISCMNNYAYYLSLEKRDLDKAEEMSYRTIKAEPDNKTYLDTYAWILFIKEEYTEARLYIDRVVSPEATDDELLTDSMINAVLLEHAADIHYLCGDKTQAVRLWQLAVRRKDGTGSSLLLKKSKKKKYIEK